MIFCTNIQSEQLLHSQSMSKMFLKPFFNSYEKRRFVASCDITKLKINELATDSVNYTSFANAQDGSLSYVCKNVT